MNRHTNTRLLRLYMYIFFLFLFSFSLFAQKTDFRNANIRFDEKDGTPIEIKFKPDTKLSLSSFISDYKLTFAVSADNEIETFSAFQDQIGQTHYRLKQFYKGIELAEVQMLAHEKSGYITHAHGKLIHGLNIDITPRLSQEEALRYALRHVNAESYMWETPKNEAFIKKDRNDPEATFYPRGELKLSAGTRQMTRDNFRLVYRFNIYAERPLGRYFVDVDAKTGKIINVLPLLHSGDVQGEGLSLYNETVQIVVTDTIVEPASLLPSRWHLSSWNALGGNGQSWWVADTNLGYEGGYGNEWYEVIDTDEIFLHGSNCALSFYHRYLVEAAGGEPEGYDGWDGMNVRISTDGGESWQVLEDEVYEYSNASLYSFGYIHAEGTGIPGWTGSLNDWTKVSMDLSSYTGNTVKIRFAFASDGGLSTEDGAPELFGWQIDSILVSNSNSVLFSNDGVETGMSGRNFVKEIYTILSGNYRLRQDGRGNGIATYDMQNGTSYSLAVDFVDEDSSFTDPNARAGVSVHWASEAFFDYYSSIHGRQSFDNVGGRIKSYVHFNDDFFNAFWDGERASYGDGTNNGFPLVSVDVVAHELTHGVTDYAANLIYQNEPGALNESFSDIFGAMVEFYLEGESGDWLIGEDFWPGVGAMRSMDNPNTEGQPDTYFGDQWFPLTSTPTENNDYGGVHVNSGVQNYWFYLLSDGGSGTNDLGYTYNVTGIGKDDAALIAYRTLTAYLMPTSIFYDARMGSMNSASDLFGDDSQQLQSVIEAWEAVGVERPYISPAVGFVNDTIDFSAEYTITNDTLAVNIYNYGLDTLRITDIQISGSNFVLYSAIDFPVSLNTYGDNLSIDVIFSPPGETVVIDSMTIFSNDPVNPVKKLYLHGTGFVIHQAQDGEIYAVTGSSANGVLLTVDPGTGNGETVGSSGFEALTSVSIHPVSGELYGTSLDEYFTRLVRINASAGDAYELSQVPLIEMRAITFDLDGDLYGITTTEGDLYMIDPPSGDTTFIGSTGIPWILGLAINPLTGELWGSSVDDEVYKIKKTTAEATLIGESGLGRSLTIAFDDAGKLYGLSGSTSQNRITEFLLIDTTDGSGTLIGLTDYRTVNGLAIRGEITSIENISTLSVPTRFELSQNYPNPFNPSTFIEFSIPKKGQVSLKIYNMLGEEIATIFSDKLNPGRYKKEWNAGSYASGVYFYRLVVDSYGEAEDFVLTKKLVFIK